MKHRVALAVLVVAGAAVPAAAQFSSDVPGIPRAAISIRGGHQDRTEWAFSGYRIPTKNSTTETGDTLAGGLRVGFGRSYRLFSQFELGYDFTLFDAYAVQPPTPKSTGTPGTSVKAQQYIRGLAGYGFRIGGKYRPIVALDPDGYGYEIAFGASIQPELKPLYGIEKLGDSVRQGGQFMTEKTPPSSFYRSNPFAKLSSATDIAAMASYRTRRLLLDGALVAEKVAQRTNGDPSPVGPFDGFSIRGGGTYRIMPSIALGAAFWGIGAPPWRDEVRLGQPGVAKADKYGFLVQFGSNPEAGIDLMYASPTGNFAESGRLYIRARSTR